MRIGHKASADRVFEDVGGGLLEIVVVPDDPGRDRPFARRCDSRIGEGGHSLAL